jgi:predicted HTH transcriptional regulator
VVQPARAWHSRQQQALAYVQANGEITNRTYQQLTGVSQKQTVRDLNELVEQGVLTRVGNGRATRYVLRERQSSPEIPNLAKSGRG